MRPAWRLRGISVCEPGNKSLQVWPAMRERIEQCQGNSHGFLRMLGLQLGARCAPNQASGDGSPSPICTVACLSWSAGKPRCHFLGVLGCVFSPVSPVSRLLEAPSHSPPPALLVKQSYDITNNRVPQEGLSEEVTLEWGSD